MPIDLHTRYLGLDLRSPLVASPSPLTGNLDDLRRLEAAGAAAVVLPSLFEEQLAEEARTLQRRADARAAALATAGALAALRGYNTGPTGYLTLVEQAKAALSIPVIASLNAVQTGSWLDYAPTLEQAGADAVELNLYFLATHLGLPGSEIETRCRTLVAALRQAITIPIAVKLHPFFTAIGNMALQLANAGATGLVLFNRFYQPDIDTETLKPSLTLTLSSSEELRLPLRWIALLHGQLPVSLAITGGVHTGLDVVKSLAAGADVAMTASALLQHGPSHLTTMERGLHTWLQHHGYSSVTEIRGQASAHAADSAVDERANYVQTLATSAFRPPHTAGNR